MLIPVFERIGRRSNSSPSVSCSVFIRLSLYPATTLLPFGSWTLIIFPCSSQWEPSAYLVVDATGWENAGRKNRSRTASIIIKPTLHSLSLGLLRKENLIRRQSDVFERVGSHEFLQFNFGFNPGFPFARSFFTNELRPTAAHSLIRLPIQSTFVFATSLLPYSLSPTTRASIFLIKRMALSSFRLG